MKRRAKERERKKPTARCVYTDSHTPWPLMADFRFGFSKTGVRDIENNSAMLRTWQHC